MKTNKPVEYNEKDYEFMNSLSSAILESSPTKTGKVIKIWLFTIFAFIIWASFAEIDEITRGDGKVIPYGQNQVIQNLEGGIVEAILPASLATFSLVPRDIASGEFTKLDQRFNVRIKLLNIDNDLKVGMGATVAIKRTK